MYFSLTPLHLHLFVLNLCLLGRNGLVDSAELGGLGCIGTERERERRKQTHPLDNSFCKWMTTVTGALPDQRQESKNPKYNLDVPYG